MSGVQGVPSPHAGGCQGEGAIMGSHPACLRPGHPLTPSLSRKGRGGVGMRGRRLRSNTGLRCLPLLFGARAASLNSP